MKTEIKTEKELRGTPADPNGTLTVVVYNKRRQKFRGQRMKRKTLMGRIVLYETEDGQKHPGKIIGFNAVDGQPFVLKSEEKHIIKDTKKFFVVEE